MHDGRIEQLTEDIENPAQLADVLTEIVLSCWEDSDQTAETRGALVGAVAVTQHRVLTFIEEPSQ